MVAASGAEPATSAAARLAIDGRVARRDRNRTAVIDAAIEMFSEGVLDPGLDEVAERCGLSSRSVYRYFDDRTALLKEAIERQFDNVRPLTRIHAIGQGDLDGRIERFVVVRLALYEAVASTARAARRRAETSDIVREQVELTRARLTEQVHKHFAPELRALPARRRRAVALAVDTLCQFEGLDHYRLHRNTSAEVTRGLLRDALHRLLDPPR
jgi:AcrR family transcriptional regulator